MSKTYLADLPSSLDIKRAWKEVASLGNLQEAISFVRAHLDGDDKGRINPTLELETDDDVCCSCCGSGLNTVAPCPTCGKLICDDCSDGVHICDPDHLY